MGNWLKKLQFREGFIFYFKNYKPENRTNSEVFRLAGTALQLLQNFCSFSKVPDTPLFTRFKQNFEVYINNYLLSDYYTITFPGKSVIIYICNYHFYYLANQLVQITLVTQNLLYMNDGTALEDFYFRLGILP